MYVLLIFTILNHTFVQKSVQRCSLKLPYSIRKVVSDDRHSTWIQSFICTNGHPTCTLSVLSGNNQWIFVQFKLLIEKKLNILEKLKINWQDIDYKWYIFVRIRSCGQNPGAQADVCEPRMLGDAVHSCILLSDGLQMIQYILVVMTTHWVHLCGHWNTMPTLTPEVYNKRRFYSLQQF